MRRRGGGGTDMRGALTGVTAARLSEPDLLFLMESLSPTSSSTNMMAGISTMAGSRQEGKRGRDSSTISSAAVAFVAFSTSASL